MLRRAFRPGFSHIACAAIVFFVCVLFDSSPCFSTTKKPPLHPINLNTATSAELQQVPGIGPATADKILKMRKSYGPFKSVDDLRAIKGIGPKRLEKMRKYLTVGKSSSSPKTSSGNHNAPNSKTSINAPPTPHSL